MKVFPIKENAMAQYKLFVFVYLSLFSFLGCQPKDKFEWNAGMSAPKFYGNAGPYVEFFYQGKNIAGASAGIGISPGWGDTSGGYTGGENFKPVPDSIFVKWVCAVDQLEYEGGAKLPQEQLLKLFRTPLVDAYGYNSPYSLIIAGTAPGGNVSVWIRGAILTEVIKFKAKNKGIWKENDPDYGKYLKEFRERSEGYKEANVFRYLHGIPYDIWEKGEKVYSYYMGSSSEEKNYKLNIMSYSQDGSVYSFDYDYLIPWEDRFDKYPKQYKLSSTIKLPVQLYIQWYSKDEKRWFSGTVVCPQNLEEQFTSGYINPITNNREVYDRIIVSIGEDTKGNIANGIISLVGKSFHKDIMHFELSRYDYENKKSTGANYTLPKDFVFPKWEGREPLVVPEIEFWREQYEPN